MALKWVHQHINAFGGDPLRVTISGHSAGSVSAHLHMFSPASKDLFRNAILMSGVGNSPFARLTIDQRAVVDKLATAAGITNAEKMPSNELAAALRTVPAMDLVKAGGALKVWDVHPFVNFRPNLEDESWPEPFMTRNLFQLTRSVNMPQTVPWIGGSMLSTGEGTVMALKLVSDPVLQAEFNKNFDEHFTLVLELNGTKNTEKVDEIIERLVAEYMGGVRELNKDTMDGFLALLGDAYFTHPLYRTIAADLNSGAGAAHSLTGALQFVYRGPYTFSQFFTGSSKDYGAVHVDDMLYLFGMPLLIPNGLPKSSAEYEIMKKYVGLYVEYAKNGNVEIFTKIGPCTIESFERSDGSGICDYLSIANGTEPFKVEHTWNVARMQLWDYVDKTLF
ncbi:unnamed protein product [Ceratitis capitata]|uniref:Carboxylic ester hydrolase n=2 Tax=Ceratitis capitata TaxID=7213 RepID=A0A811VH94_CERCA|nr:unnamed protein product [Ceratitis capitata]